MLGGLPFVLFMNGVSPISQGEGVWHWAAVVRSTCSQVPWFTLGSFWRFKSWNWQTEFLQQIGTGILCISDTYSARIFMNLETYGQVMCVTMSYLGLQSKAKLVNTIQNCWGYFAGWYHTLQCRGTNWEGVSMFRMMLYCCLFRSGNSSEFLKKLNGSISDWLALKPLSFSSLIARVICLSLCLVLDAVVMQSLWLQERNFCSLIVHNGNKERALFWAK